MNDMVEELKTEAYPEPQRGSRVGLIITIFLLLLALGGCGVLAYFWTQDKTAMLKQQDEMRHLQSDIIALEASNADLGGQLEDQRAENQRVRAEWDTQVAQLKKDHREQMERTYAQMDDIIHDSRKTLDYIATMERKLKSGQALSKEEAQQLMAIGNGLTFLHKQYEKPIEEFRELEKFLAEQLNVAAVVEPAKRNSFFKRMFSKDYREHEAEYFRDQGKRDAFARSRAKVSEAYARAQAQMQQLSVRSTEYLEQLQAIVDSNEAGAADIDAFFDQSKEILQIHDRIMSMEPERPAQVRP